MLLASQWGGVVVYFSNVFLHYSAPAEVSPVARLMGGLHAHRSDPTQIGADLRPDTFFWGDV